MDLLLLQKLLEVLLPQVEDKGLLIVVRLSGIITGLVAGLVTGRDSAACPVLWKDLNLLVFVVAVVVVSAEQVYFD